ncbi:MAG: glycosyltransferase family A protein [Calothrix sp. MO_192.B10]|nr:glycosyltransferase family A protein [Calothrix sp. MO_192.B10]
MKHNSLVSVIVIFLNGEEFIQEAIESVRYQTHENWELLLVDDGSTDNSTLIAQQYARKYSNKIRYLEHDNHQNRGMSATRNLGIQNARGKYITFLDADDVWLPQNLERQVKILHKQPEAGMVYMNTHYWYSWTGEPNDVQKEFCDEVVEITKKPNSLFEPPKLLTILLDIDGAVPCVCSLMIKRDLLEAIGGFEESFRGLYEDQVFYAKVCLQAPVFVASECWAKYRQHPNSCCAMAQNTEQEEKSRLFFLNWLEQYLTEKQIKDQEVWQTLREKLWPYRHPILSKLTRRVQIFSGKIKAFVRRLNQRINFAKL